MPCTAGETSIVIDHNGKFRACEMRGIVGDLHDYDFDMRRALESDAMRAEVGAIPGANCWCTHSCFIQDSSKFSAKAQLVPVPTSAARSSGVTIRLVSCRTLLPSKSRRPFSTARRPTQRDMIATNGV